jgi:uncharacterized protein YndB with AHSA1/START domain
MANGAPAPSGDVAFTEPGPMAAVHLARTFAAPRERVFRAWTEADAVVRWFGGPLGSTESVETDVRVGGRYRITFKSPPGRTVYLAGTFLEVDPPKRLVYTFAWERMPLLAFRMGDSKVTVEFHELADETEVRLTHELLDKRRLRAFHRWGWNHSLDMLARLLTPKAPR